MEFFIKIKNNFFLYFFNVTKKKRKIKFHVTIIKSNFYKLYLTTPKTINSFCFFCNYVVLVLEPVKCFF